MIINIYRFKIIFLFSKDSFEIMMEQLNTQ